MYCCVVNGTTINCVHLLQADANNCLTTQISNAANANLLTAAGVPSTVVASPWLYNQLNNSLGITQDALQTAIAAVTNYAVQSVVINL